MTFSTELPLSDELARQTSALLLAYISWPCIGEIARDVGETSVSPSITIISANSGDRQKRHRGRISDAATPSNSCMIHNPNYDFNDGVIPTGIAWWKAMVAERLS